MPIRVVIRYQEAEVTAGFALDIDPRNIKARYRRGLARKALKTPRAARAGNATYFVFKSKVL